jgi:hypothetical protein
MGSNPIDPANVHSFQAVFSFEVAGVADPDNWFFVYLVEFLQVFGPYLGLWDERLVLLGHFVYPL